MTETSQTPKEVSLDDDEEIEEFSEKYDFVGQNDQKLRCFIAETMSSGDVDGKILVSNMQMVYEWIQTGTSTNQQPTKNKSKPSFVGIVSSASTK